MTIIIGSILCALAGVGVGSFLLPLKFSKSWRWENSWLVGAFFMYVVFPLVGLWLIVPEFSKIFAQTPSRDIWMIYIFGLVQGTGAYVFTYGTTLMGLALGYALMISCIALVSTMIPLFGAHIDRVGKLDGITLLIGAAMLIVGFALAGRAGLAREAGAADKTENAAERKVSKLLVVVVVLWSGFANALYYFTFEFQKSMKDIAMQQFNVEPYEWGFLNIVPFFLGMFTVNLILTVVKMAKDGTLKNYWSAPGLPREYSLGFVIALLWYLGQGVAYPAGQGVLGPLGVAVGAALFMGMIMVVANIAGIRTGEWKGASRGTIRILYAAIVVLVLAVAVIAAGNYLQQYVFEVK
ncbi:MAG: hypothetical protein A2147_09315 [Chloroflexi bacterium RBG_16_57_8]|nr:MAG: hypothetical protein A2147_09315 [Chloroflexi bacterium RBG_16_57_8]